MPTLSISLQGLLQMPLDLTIFFYQLNVGADLFGMPYTIRV